MKALSSALLQVLGAGVAMTVAATPVFAQQVQRVEKMEITGSNIKRIEGETALPVTVITREEIQKSGITTAAELMDRVSATSGGGYNVSQGVGDSGTPGLSATSLRGLGTTNTLILLNGRRVADYAFAGGGIVNLNQVPLAAIERVEVLKDGASAIYGTDAIGGVINFILRKDYQGAEVTAYGTRTEGGGGNTRKYSAAAGFGDINKQRFNVLVAVDYQKDTPLKASQRPQFAGTAIRPDLGFAQTSGNAPPANFIFNGTLYNVAAAQGCDPAAGSFQVDAGTGAPQPTRLNCRYDFTSVLDIFPPAERKSLFTRGVFAITPNHQAFVEYHLSKNEITFASSETPVNDFTGNGPFIYPAGGPFYPTSFVTPAAAGGQTIRPTGDLVLSGWRAKQGGLRTNRADSEESRLVAGLQGSLFGWDYNTAVTRSESEASDNYIDGWFSERRLRDAIATGRINVFTTAPLDAAGQALLESAKVLETVRIGKNTVNTFDARISRELMEMRGGPLALALGFERREEEMDDRPQEVLFSGDLLGGGGALPPVRADRDINAIFAELNIPILRNIEMQLAVRHDDYSDFGTTTNPKVAFRWTPTPQFLVRGSYSTGFRAPTLSDLFLPRFESNTADTHNDPIRCPGGVPVGGFVNPVLECDTQFNAQLGGNNALQPEESRNWTLGMIFEPTPQWSFGVDFFQIHRENSIGALGDTAVFDTFVAADPLAGQGRLVRRPRLPGGGCQGDLPGAPPTPANVPCAVDFVVLVQENLGDYWVRGMDVSATGRFNMGGMGRFTLRAEGTYLFRYRYQEQAGGPYLDNQGAFTSTNGAIPRWKHVVVADWRTGPFGVTVNQNFVLGYRDASGTRRVGSYETYDAQVSWDAWRGLGISVGVKNLLDRDPPASDQGQTFQVGYDPTVADARGRMYYLGLRYTFK